jgi:hypothetical protein
MPQTPAARLPAADEVLESAMASGSLPLCAAEQVVDITMADWLGQGLAEDLREAVALGSRDAWQILPRLVTHSSHVTVGSACTRPEGLAAPVPPPPHA